MFQKSLVTVNLPLMFAFYTYCLGMNKVHFNLVYIALPHYYHLNFRVINQVILFLMAFCKTSSIKVWIV